VTTVVQGDLFEESDDLIAEDPDYLRKQLVTYIGNKRQLGKQIGDAVAQVRARLGGRRLVAADLFAGSGFVSRLMKQHAETMYVNDIEPYAGVLGQCFLANREQVDVGTLAELVSDLNARAERGMFVDGFIQEMYAPQNDREVQMGERVFYTSDNARRLDLFAQAVAELPSPERALLLGPLLSRASVHANTSGVFKGFYKDKGTGIGKFGASAGDALARIMGKIELEVPVLSAFSAEVHVNTSDANALAPTLPELDVAYIDPPYNQHPYGSNYFMLNLLTNYAAPPEVSAVSGIPTDWNRSGYNVKKRAATLLEDLVESTPAKFLIVSFNDEGFVAPIEIGSMLASRGKVSEVVTQYNAFRGSRNLRDRNIHVHEHVFVLERA